MTFHCSLAIGGHPLAGISEAKIMKIGKNFGGNVVNYLAKEKCKKLRKRLW